MLTPMTAEEIEAELLPLIEEAVQCKALLVEFCELSNMNFTPKDDPIERWYCDRTKRLLAMLEKMVDAPE